MHQIIKRSFGHVVKVPKGLPFGAKFSGPLILDGKPHPVETVEYIVVRGTTDDPERKYHKTIVGTYNGEQTRVYPH